MIKNKKNILLIGTVPPPMGGDAIWMYNYIQELEKRKITYSFVNTSLVGNRAKNINNRKNLFEELYRFLRIKKQLNAAIKENVFEYCHFNINCSKLGTFRDYFIAKNLRRHKINFVLHCHCDIADQIGKKHLPNLYLKKLFSLAQNIFVLNKSSLDFCNRIGFKNIIIIPNFISEKNILNCHKIEPIVKNVLFVGHIKKTKGIEEFLYLSKMYPQITFHIAGKITGDFNIKNAINSVGLKNVKVYNNVEHSKIFEMLDYSDVFVFPSYTEGFSLALLEAMSRGIPIIASDVGANEEMLSENSGLLVAPKSKEELLNAFIKIISSVDLRTQLSRNCIQKVKSCYSSEIIISKIVSSYRDITLEK